MCPTTYIFVRNINKSLLCGKQKRLIKSCGVNTIFCILGVSTMSGDVSSMTRELQEEEEISKALEEKIKHDLEILNVSERFKFL